MRGLMRKDLYVGTGTYRLGSGLSVALKSGVWVCSKALKGDFFSNYLFKSRFFAFLRAFFLYSKIIKQLKNNDFNGRLIAFII